MQRNNNLYSNLITCKQGVVVLGILSRECI